jgi:SPP1 family phage portal protein
VDFEALDEVKRVEFVRKAVSDFLGSARMERANDQRNHYRTENPDIAKRCKLYAASETAADGTMRAVAKENRFAANEKVANPFFRKITDAKVQYLAGEGADVNAENEADAETVQAIVNALGFQLRRIEQACLTDALVYSSGYAYMQVINDRLKLQHIPYCEVIPFRDRTGALEAVMRYYKRDGVEYADFHTPAKIYSFERNQKARNGSGWKATGETWQILTGMIYGDGTIENTGGKGWKRLPWFELWHNNDHASSLTHSVKTMIRCYDIVVSDFANNLIDLQDVFVSLKQDSAYSGMEHGEIIEMLKNFKVAEGVESVTSFEVPYMARQVLLDIMKAGIYEGLQGVDVKQLAGGQKTATEIKAAYSDIDLWADQAEWHVNDWVRDVLSFAADYMGVALPPVTVSCQRRVMFDEVAQMQAVASQKGIISDKTLFENHPLVKDAQQELERVAAQELDPAYSGEL